MLVFLFARLAYHRDVAMWFIYMTRSVFTSGPNVSIYRNIRPLQYDICLYGGISHSSVKESIEKNLKQ